MIALGRVWDPRGAVVGRSSVARDRGRENPTNKNRDCIAAGVHVPSPVNFPTSGKANEPQIERRVFERARTPQHTHGRAAAAAAGVCQAPNLGIGAF